MTLEEKRLTLLTLAQAASKHVFAASDPSFKGKLKKLADHGVRYLAYHTLMSLGKRWRPKNFRVQTFWQKELLLSLEEAESLYYYGTLSREEQPSILFLLEHLKEKDVFFDIGAHYGFYTSLARELITQGEIHAFEPSPKIFQYLDAVFSGGGKNIFLNNVALSDCKGSLPFFDGSAEGESGSGTLLKNVAQQNISTYQEISVDVTTLDEYVRARKHPTIIKLDVEGSEFNIIQGGQHTLEKSSPIILMEVWRGKIGEKFSLPAIRALYELGYQSFGITSSGELVHIPNLVPSGDKNYAWGSNFVFKKK
ncbi:MAG: FkbM family methyltransferase [Candidatus Liptonbacteria bacterium]|nr:FkbM family methyltransferase [Candidatus Liptonbacteria bacterium]